MTGMETMLPGGELLYRSACTYDRAGNRTGREEQYRDAFSGPLHTAVTTYTYDGMGRLTGEELDGKLTGYSYDMAGNRLSRTTEGRTERYHYNSRSQLTGLDSAAETVQYEYDHAGNLTAESHIPQGGNITRRIEYTYDAYNRNTSVCSAGCVQQNHYDAEGLRNAVTENGSTTNFVYRNGMLSSELDADRNPVRGYVCGNEYISQNNGSSFSYYLDDEQGSIRYLTGSDGSIRNHYRYSAFGESITAEETVPNRLKYNAQMADELTGLYYLRARYYNASLGRFTQEDTIYNDGLNLYAYCNSNPVMYSDPSGFAKETCKSKVGGECDSESGKYSVGDATFMDADDTFVSNISRRTDVDANGYFDVIAHGTPNGIQITHNEQHMIVDHKTAARLIQNSDGYNGQAIRLLSCNTGALDNGFAQNLANKLNVEVYAPTYYLWSTPNGNYFVAGMNNLRLPDMNNRGIFKLFSPGGN